jgi:flavin-dependent dehydrogenase
MDRLINDGKIYKMGMIGVTGGLIPVGGYQKPSYFKNLLLVGDAAGQTNPITGAGLLQAVTCGRIAGEVASNAAIAKDICILEEYEVRWREIFGDSLDRALTKRKFLDAHWSDKQEFEKVVRESWITS